jgi:hypothetical protein
MKIVLENVTKSQVLVQKLSREGVFVKRDTSEKPKEVNASNQKIVRNK